MTAQSARQAATAHLQEASVAINTMFDRQDAVIDTLTKIAESAATGNNVFTRTQAVLDQTNRLTEQIAALQTAALDATEHRSKRDLARDLWASPSVVFPHHHRRRPPTSNRPPLRAETLRGSENSPFGGAARSRSAVAVATLTRRRHSPTGVATATQPSNHESSTRCSSTTLLTVVGGADVMRLAIVTGPGAPTRSRWLT